MTQHEKDLYAKIESLEAENRRLFHFETAMLQVRAILAAYLPPNHGLARDAVVDIISIVEEVGFPLPRDMARPHGARAAPGVPGATIVPFPLASGTMRKH